jgi:hypothetical protein
VARLWVLGAAASGLAAHLHAHVQRARAQVLDVGQVRPDAVDLASDLLDSLRD